jgi:hypothetical protein
MPIAKKTDVKRNGRTKCFIHEVQRPLDVSYSRFEHHVCWICQTRLQELARINFEFSIDQQTYTVSELSGIPEDVARPDKNSKAKKK